MTLNLQKLLMKFNLPALLILFFFSFDSKAQSVSVDTLHKYGIYDLDRLSPEFHKSRRDELRSHMAPHTAALFLSALEKNRSNDDNYLFHQDPNFYYLTGHTQADAALLITKEPIIVNGIPTNEVIFVQKKNLAQEVWKGVRLGTEGAKSVLKFSAAIVIDSLKEFLKPVLEKIDTFYYNSVAPKSIYDPVLDTTWLLWQSVKDGLENRYSGTTYATNKMLDKGGISINRNRNYNPITDDTHKDIRTDTKLGVASLKNILAEMRSIKQDEELRLMRKAIKVSNEAHNEIIRSAKPGWYEYQMQALGEYIFTKNGCEYVGYPCIVGSGNNSTILHYESNRRQTEPGDFIEMDMGAEYHGYTADITRSFPINGKFANEQRIIYDLVLEAQDSGIAQAKVGNDFKAPHRAAVSVITRGLINLGIISNPDDYKKYFMHGTSHFLGLDVHDAGNSAEPLKDRQVITVEPGIYIAEGSPCDKKWWKIGCRIEDDILITPSGPEILSKDTPRKAEDIEKLMSGH